MLSILDTRYREKYGFSLVENLRYIQEYGVKEFLKLEKQRANLARKLQNPRLLQIHFHTFRHWKATMLCHQTNGNIYYVKKFLGHKNIRNTENYIHLAEVIFSNEKPEYTCEPARTVKEAKALIEKGFSYECEIDGVKLFKKVK